MAFAIALLIVALGVVGLFRVVGTNVTAAPLVGPDLTVEIELSPTVPALGQETEIKVIVRNQGGVNVADSVKVFLYVDPPQQPPTDSTPGFPFSTPGLNAGASFQASLTRTFDTAGCDHVVYAWVDRDETIVEENENNNLTMLPICVGVDCSADGFEVDNSCTEAGWLTETGLQSRSFCHASNPTLPDVDWVKFTAVGGITYTVAATNPGVHAAPQVTLYRQCGGAPLSSDGAKASVHAESSTLLFAKIEHADGAAPGPLTEYILGLDAQSDVTDNYEPDDRCELARDISTDGARQTHLFQTPGDQDWVRFEVKAGESFIALTENTAADVAPEITLFDSCADVPGEASFGITATRVEQSTETDRTIYARVRNSPTGEFGAQASYDLAVLASDCTGDASEPDDSFAAARTRTVGGTPSQQLFCPAQDEDWSKIEVEAGKTYVARTTDLGPAADTVLHLYAPDGVTEIAQSDDYGYTRGSRIVWAPDAGGVNYLRVRHHGVTASGPRTAYSLAVDEGVCVPDSAEQGVGDNGPADAPPIPIDGSPLARTFCPDPLRIDIADQDWVKFAAVPGGNYDIRTQQLGVNSDTVLELYAADGRTLVATSDDAGPGRSGVINFTAPRAGDYYVRIRQYNNRVGGSEAQYQLAVFGQIPPTPTPTPTPSPTPMPSPTPLPTVEPSTVKTLILFNFDRFAAVHGQAAAGQTLDKLYELAQHADVEGAVLLVEKNAAVAAAYAAWTADAASLTDNAKANQVAGAVRNVTLDFLATAPMARNVVIVGDERVIPHRRVPDRVTKDGGAASNPFATTEDEYAADVTNATIAAALSERMVLTDDYYVDKTPSEWMDKDNNVHPLYIPDYGLGRLVQSPSEIVGTINLFLAGRTITADKALVIGYDFVQDSAETIATTLQSDGAETDKTLIGNTWLRDAFTEKHLTSGLRWDIQSLNGHSTHVATLLPTDPAGQAQADVIAAEIAAATTDMARTLIFNVGCHAGLNDPGILDLTQAFVGNGASYIGNTGYGWGGGGAVYSEAVMKGFAVEVLQGTQKEIGPALAKAKERYYTTSLFFNAYSAKVVMQVVLYGLPNFVVESSGTFDGEQPFPSVDASFTPPTAFGAETSAGTLGYGLPQSFASFGETPTADGTVLDLDTQRSFGANEPIQPQYYADASAPGAGALRGVIFTSGVYSDITGFDPVIASPVNEWVTEHGEPDYTAQAWDPPLPFTIRSGQVVSATGDTVIMSLGQYNGKTATERIYSQMTFDTLYSQSADTVLPVASVVDGILLSGDMAEVKVEAADSSGIDRVVVVFTDGGGLWESRDLAFNAATQKWRGRFPAGATTVYYIQIADGAGNVTVIDNKGLYYSPAPPLPLVEGEQLEAGPIYLPFVVR